jgi:beta-glucosidase
MLGSLTWLGLVAAATAQFDFVHTQYDTSPPVYPSPEISGAGGWDAALERARTFLAELTLEEKSSMVTGTWTSFTALGSPSVCPRQGISSWQAPY